MGKSEIAIPPRLRARVAEGLADDVRMRGGHLNTGVLGTKYLLRVLTHHGYPDLALQIATQRDFPSWGAWIEAGATTLWESWSEHARSRGHYFFGTIDDWLYADVAGLRPDDAGWSVINFSPRVLGCGLRSAEASVETPRGRAGISWRTVGSRVEIEVEVPVGSRGRVCLGDDLVEVRSGRTSVETDVPNPRMTCWQFESRSWMWRW